MTVDFMTVDFLVVNVLSCRPFDYDSFSLPGAECS
jgi:hypothetical protein